MCDVIFFLREALSKTFHFIWTRIRLRGLHKGEKLEKIRKKKRKREKERERERETKKKIRKRENGGRHVWSYVEGCCEVPRASVD